MGRKIGRRPQTQLCGDALSFTQFRPWAKPLSVVYRMACFSFASANTRSIVSFRSLYMRAIERCMPGVFRQILVVLPDMPRHGLDTAFGLCALLSAGAAGGRPLDRFCIPVAISVGCTVVQYLVFWADDTVIVFIVYVFPPFVAALHGSGAVCRLWTKPPILKYLFANMGRFVGAVGYYGRYFRVLLYHFVIYIVKGHAVMDVAGGHFHVEHKAVDIACRMCFIGNTRSRVVGPPFTISRCPDR